VTGSPPGRARPCRACPFQASTDQQDSADRMDPTLAAEPTESTDPIEPTEPTDRIEPADPIDKMDPAEPIDKIDPLEPMLRMDPSVFRMRSFSQMSSGGDQGPRQAVTVIPTGARSLRNTAAEHRWAATALIRTNRG
jgi:hypothetical protein